MKASARIVFLGAVAGILLLSGASAPAQNYSLIKSFGVSSNVSGFTPYGTLVRGADGTLYGTLGTGEAGARGSVFRIQPDGAGFTVLKLFTNAVEGSDPYGGLVLAGSTLYGTTSRGGASNTSAGTIFKVETNGANFSVLKSFGYYDGSYPIGELVMSGGTLYGATRYGGTNGLGTLFKINTSGTGFTVLNQLSATDAVQSPTAGMTLDGNTLYGCADRSGTNSKGALFKVGTDGVGLTAIHQFSGMDGSTPSSCPLMLGGMLYGLTYYGGSQDRGVLYRTATNGSGYTVLRSFTWTTGAWPRAGLLAVGTTLYGTTGYGGTAGSGTVFKVATNGTGYAVLRNLTAADGKYPSAGLASDGSTLYGVASQGGGSELGTVFKLSTNGTGFSVLKSFAYSDAFNPSGGVLLIGDTLYGATTAGGGGLGAVIKVGTNGTGYTIVTSFKRTNGASPSGDLTAVGNTLYGATTSGGSGDYGTLFKVNADGTGFKTLKNYTYNNGSSPNGELIVTNGMVYGTTRYGGSGVTGYGNIGGGTVFKMTTNGTGYIALKNFPNVVFYFSDPYYYTTNTVGANPFGGLVLSGNTLYGTTYYGGKVGYGTLFKVNTDGTGFAVLRNLDYGDGLSPSAAMVVSGNTLYGTSENGGPPGAYAGTVFKINTDGTGYGLLKGFGYYDGFYPRSRVTLNGGLLYGTTASGGAYGSGIAFRLNTNGTGFVALKNFNAADGQGANPAGSLLLNGAVAYGTTKAGGASGVGAVYSLTLGPVFTNQPVSLTVTSSFVANFSAMAVGDEPLRYQWWKGASPLSGQTNSSYTIASTVTNDTGNYFVVVTNLYGSATSTTAVLTVASGLPFITSQPQGATNLEGAPASFTAIVSGSPPLNYQWLKGASPIANATNTNYTIASTVTNDAGNYSVIITNGFGSVTSAVAVLGVISGAPQVLTQPTSATNLAGTAVNFSVAASGTSPLSYQWWKGITSQTGRTNASYIIGSVTLGDAGNYYVIVTNNFGSATSTVASLTIGCPAITVNPASLPNTLIAAAYSQSLTATGGVAPYAFTVTSGALPGGLNLSGAGLLSGTPTNTGTFNFTATAIDSNTCAGARSYAITVSCSTVAVGPALLPGGTIGTPYSATNTASGGTAPYTFAVTSGLLPGGLGLTNGVLSGTPTNTGDFNFTITATDTNGCSGSLSYVITVGCANIAVSPALLPNGFSETAYQQTLSASGGVPPYMFTLLSGSLPSGWSLTTNGVLSGTTTDPGDYSFIVSAADVNNCSGSVEYSLKVDDVPHPTNMTWIATVDADWDEPDNWSPQQVPGPLDTANISLGVEVFIGPDITVSNLNMSAARLAGNSLTVLGTMNWNGGVISNSVTIASNAVLNWINGDLLGAVTVLPGGTLVVSNAVTMGYNNNNRNGGGVISNGGTVIQAAALYGYGESIVQNAGVWQFAGDQALNEQHGTNIFINTGTVLKSSGSGSATITWKLNTTGTMNTPSGSFSIYQWAGTNVLHGTLNLAGGMMTAPLSLASNAVLNWSNGDLLGALTVDLGAILAITSPVTMGYTNNYRDGGGAITNNGLVVMAANLYGYGRAVIHNAALWQLTGDYLFGNQFGTNIFINTGSFQKTGGVGVMTADWWFNTTGTVNATNGSLSLYQWTGTNVLNGTMKLSGGTMNAPLTVASNALLNWTGGDLISPLIVAPGGTLAISSPVTMGYVNNFRNGGGWLTNYGTVVHSATINGYGRAVIHNAGQWQTAGDFAVTDFQGTNIFVNTGTFAKTGGTGVETMDWWFNTTGIMNVTNGSMSVTKWTNASTLNGTLMLSGGDMTAPITVASNATLNWAGGALDSLLTIAPGGLLNISNNVSLAFNNWNLTLTNFVALTNSGTVNWDGTARGYGGALIYNAGSWHDSGDHMVINQVGSNTFVNIGTLQKTGGSGTSSIEWYFTQAGQLDVLSGTFTLTGIASQTNGTTKLNGGNLSVSSPFPLLGGLLAGTGSITGSLTNGANVSPGFSPGQLTVTGNYVQTPNGTLRLELAGTSPGVTFDRLVVNGTAALAGSLVVTLTNSFFPVTNSTFTILTASSRTGAFGSFTYPSTVIGMIPIYNPDSVVLFVTNAPPPFGPYLESGNLVAHFLALPGTNYTIEWTPAIRTNNWQKLTNIVAPTNDAYGLGAGVLELRTPLTTSNRFFRAVRPAY